MAAYQTRPDANAVVHNHAVHCTAVSILNRPIPAIHYMIAAAGGKLYSLRALRHFWHPRTF
ncbi:L-fuculose phosphate aldolase [Salmonella enterica subsp. enterica]|uniref:L-fuculose phosphate aldolase n=1 Tax=Salmonella enterica I TaxID=59201 RepID=A0A3S4IH79_SALET|nr:L-fuculose phosphate aldolase [Salmonella enterica subsp. enterica]